MPLVTTALYAGALTLWIIYLAFRVGQARTRSKVLMGDGGDEALLREVRAHGNAVETIPLTLLLMALTESLGAPAVAIHLAGAVLVVGRLLHGAYFFTGARQTALRAGGMGLTVLAQLGLSVGLIGHVLSGVGGAS